MKKTTMVFVSGNAGKIKEMNYLINSNLSGFEIDLLSLKDIGFDGEIIENGATFEENAEIKTRAVYDFINNKTNKTNQSDMICFADDSGLCVDYLNGAPGIYSARYGGGIAGEGTKRVLEKLKDVPHEKRTAHFYCAIYCIVSENESFCVSGKCEGIITREKIGENGFGYDPIFYYPPENKTFAEMSDEEKNNFSHRAIAVEQFVKKIVKYI